MLSTRIILLQGLALFVCCYLIHMLVWRIYRPRAYPIWLLLIFFALPGFGLSAFLILAYSGVENALFPSLHLILVLMLHGSLACAYIVLYSGLVAFSPTLAILEVIDRSMPSGLPSESLCIPWFTDQNLAGYRLENLLSSRLLIQCEEGVCLSSNGRRIASLFRSFRTCIGLPPVGGG
jgi:hypothetical protein